VAAAQEDKLLEEHPAAMQENSMVAEEAAQPHGNEAPGVERTFARGA